MDDITVKFLVIATICDALFFAIICGSLARKKGRSVIGWFILSLLFRNIALIILAFADLTYDPRKPNFGEGTMEKLWTCSSCGAENCGRDFCCNCFASKTKVVRGKKTKTKFR